MNSCSGVLYGFNLRSPGKTLYAIINSAFVTLVRKQKKKERKARVCDRTGLFWIAKPTLNHVATKKLAPRQESTSVVLLYLLPGYTLLYVIWFLTWYMRIYYSINFYIARAACDSFLYFFLIN